MLLSIIIPVGPDDGAWKTLMPQLLESKEPVEIIVSACLPKPDEALLDDERVIWQTGKQGRAKQLNLGAQTANGDYLWFLHADSGLNPAVWTALDMFLAENSESLGYFQLEFADDGPLMTQLNARLANWRSRVLGLPFGDQGYVLKKSLFEALAGFDELVPIGEDLDLVIRARAQGIYLQQLPARLISSARRYRQQGWLKTTVKHLYLTCKLSWQAQQRVRQV